MAVNDDVLARMVGHQVGLQRYATGVVKKIIALLDSVDADLVGALRDRGADGGWTSRRIAALLEDVRVINLAAYRAVQGELTSELRSLAKYEVQLQLQLLDDVLPVRLSWRTPTASALVAAVTTNPIRGALLREWVAGLERGRRDRLRGAIRIGYTEGETVDAMVRRVRGTASLNFRDGVLDVSRRSAATFVRTAVNHVATRSREMLYEDNGDLVDRVEWVSTLDLRTTPICIVRDGKTYPVGEGPRPPAHLGCRSATTPVVKSWRALGIDMDDMTPGMRASMDGQVPAKLTYGEWLKTRSVAEQDEVLGRAKGRLFRQGQLTVDKFVDSAGHAYTLEELARREAGAFRAAGLEKAA